ncbi:hypothetical protein [Rheinheimera hassiensis]|uniref:hypothetical protein n=1 Tax=Rheinheimera hassiensis TaxID=1193627 RepID=UPI001F05C604|nr:hypothetical protein [Rheinheimera hassiensis]
MDFFLLGTVLFLLANVAVAVTMLRRVNLNNDSVLAWEQAQVAAVQPVAVPQYQPIYLAKAA